jgi:hypothetical protein
MREAAADCDGETRGCDSLAGEFASSDVRQLGAIVDRTPRRGLGESAIAAGSGPQFGWPAHSLHWRSRASAKSRLRARLIREKIIGHGVCGLIPPIAGRRTFIVARRSRRAFALLARCRALALLHQPARQHGRGIFLQPDIQQLRDLLAEIGRVAKPRKLEALQGIAGSGEKKLPGRLRFVGTHGDLQREHGDVTSIVTGVNSTHVRTCCGKLCKSFARNCGQSDSTSAALGTL